MLGVHSFCSCFVGESAGYVWQFKIRILNLCDVAIEHQNSSVDYAPFNFMKSWCSPALRLHFVSCSMYWKWWKAEQGPGNEATVLCIISHWQSYSCECVCTHVCRVYVHVWEGEVFDTTLPCMWMKLLHLSESPEVPLVWFLVLAMYASLSSI